MRQTDLGEGRIEQPPREEGIYYCGEYQCPFCQGDQCAWEERDTTGCILLVGMKARVNDR